MNVVSHGKYFLMISFGLLLSSCDEEHVKEYYIQNESVEKIKINFKIDGTLDSTSISPNENKLLYTDVYYFGTVGVRDERFEDSISDINIQSSANNEGLDESLWEYEEVNKYYAKYTMTVD